MDLSGKKILVTGSDGFIGSHLTEELVRRGHDVRAFVLYNSFNSWGWLDHSPADIKDGLDVLREIRMTFAIPVIMLTAKGEAADRIVGLELGADDYLPKPFDPRELLARIKAVLRRGLPTEEEAAGDESLIINAGGLALNRAKQTLMVEDKEVELSSTEYKILEALMAHPNTVLSRDRLLNLARGRDFMAFDRSVDVHISKLRAKLDANPRFRKIIKTVWGTGYMFVDES